MSYYARSSFLAFILFSASKASADDQYRQLRGADHPIPVDDKRGSKQDLGLEGSYRRFASFTAEDEGRELYGHRTVPAHQRQHGASMSGRTRSKPLSNPRAKQHMMKGGGMASRRHGTPGGHEKMNTGRQSRHGANFEAQGSLQHVGKPSHSGGGDQHGTPASSGKRSFDSRIVGGVDADEGEYKFMATLNITLTDGDWTFCGGSLIAPDMILSVAHCHTTSIESVRIGSNSLQSGGELRGVASLCAHPNYDEMTFANDFMVIKLDSPVDTSVYPILQLNQDASLPQVDENLTVIGFGDTTDGGDPSQTLQKVEVPMNSYVLCNQQYGDIDDDIQFCAGYVEGGKDSCQGDSGGPIFEMRGSTPVQVGVVSFGTGCAQPDKSGVYARVTGAYEWIQDTMAKLDAGDTSGCGGGTSSGDDDHTVTDDDWGSSGDDDVGWWLSTGDDGGWLYDDDNSWHSG